MTSRTTERPNRITNHSTWRHLPAIAAAAAVTLLAAGAPARAQTPNILNETAKLLASDGATDDQFGYSVAINDNTAVINGVVAVDLVTAKHVSKNITTSAGLVYIFVRDESDLWTQQAQLVLDNGSGSYEQATSVAVSIDTTVVGAPNGSNGSFRPGSAFVFTRDAAGVWTQQATLLASDGAQGDYFGFSVAMDGDTAILGAMFSEGSTPYSGSAYVFTRDAAGVWTQEAKLIASDGAPYDDFGRTVAIHGDTAIVGAPSTENNGSPFSPGSAYIFKRNDAGVWTQQAKLLVSDAAFGYAFGTSVAISKDQAIVGGGVSAHVFVRNDDGLWTHQAKLIPTDGERSNMFGVSVAIRGDSAYVGDSGGFGASKGSGSVYVFKRDERGEWMQQSRLLASDGAQGDAFGASIALSDTTIVAGAIGDQDNGFRSGAAYIFDLDDDADSDDDADFDGDGTVDAGDLSSLLSQWGASGGPADLNNDGLVNSADLAILLASWG